MNDPGDTGSIKFINPLGDTVNSIPDLIEIITNQIVLPIGTIIVVLMIIWTGFKFVVAQGNETKIKDAKQMLLYTVIGALILLGAWVIANSIKGTVCLLYDNPPAALECNSR